MILALALGLLALPALLGQADRELLRSEFWADREPVPGTSEEWPVSPRLARARILDEAAWVYGGMIWGFEFTYTPFDKTRALSERFDLQPIQSLDPRELSLAAGSFAPGARGLDEGLQGALLSGDYRSFVEYRPEAALVSLMEAYSADPWKGAQGTGRADMILGVKGRRAAYIDGLRIAVRGLMQSREPNKPRLAKGRIVFDRPPTLTILAGSYTAGVKARAMVIEVLQYRVY